MKIFASISESQLGEFKRGVNNYVKSGMDAADKAAMKSAIMIHNEVIKSVLKKSPGSRKNWIFGKGERTSKEGYRYNSKGNRRDFWASAPDRTFNSDTGQTEKTIRWEYDKHAKTAYVGSYSAIAKYLELGTENMDARPWLGPALKKLKIKIPLQFQTEWKKK